MARDVDVGLASLQDGAPRHSSARLLTQRAPNERSDLGDLYLVMQGGNDQLCGTFSRTLVSSYFSNTTTNIVNSLLDGMRQAADQVAIDVSQNNRFETLGATVAVIEGDELYIAQLPPSQIFILRNDVLNALPDQSLPETHPHPEFAPDQEIEMFRVKLDEGDVVALASHDLRHELTKREIQGLLQSRLAQQAAHDICALVAQRGGQLCELLVVRVQSDQGTEFPTDPIEELIPSPRLTETPSASLPHGRTRWELPADTQPAKETTYEEPRSRPGTTLGQRLASIPLTAALILLLLPVMTIKAIVRLVSGRKHQSTSSGVTSAEAEINSEDRDPLLYDDWESLRALRETRAGSGPSSQTRTQLETIGTPITEGHDPFLPRPKKSLPGPGVFIFSLSLVLLLGMLLMYTLRGFEPEIDGPDRTSGPDGDAGGPTPTVVLNEESARNIFDEAQDKYRATLDEPEGKNVDGLLLALKNAEILATEALNSAREDVTLREDVNRLLVDIKKREETLTVVVKVTTARLIEKFTNGIGSSAKPLEVRGESIYVLDALESRVVESTPDQENSTTVLRTGDIVGSVTFQQPIALVNRALTMLVIDDDYNLVSLRSAQEPQLLRIVGTRNWRNPVAFDNFNNNLYVLDPGAGDLGTIHKYQVTAAGYEVEPIPYTNEAEGIDLSTAIDFAIDGDVFVLLKDSSVLRFSGGQKVPFEISGLFGEPLQATKIFTEVNTDSLYLVDPTNERIVEIDKTEGSAGAFVRQFKYIGKENFFAGMQSIWIDENETKLVVLGETSVRQFVIPKSAF
ncbi:MAG: hypothetical protein CL790_03050 [Chloroflexi bacterium]|nr:hypothetical protein [Chloroflexota bacterium]